MGIRGKLSSKPSRRPGARIFVSALALTSAGCGEAAPGSATGDGGAGAAGSGAMSEAPGSVVSASTELAPCNPLADWVRDMGLDNPVMVAQVSTGTYLVVTHPASGYVVWFGEGNALVPHGVTYATEGGPDVSLVVAPGSGPAGGGFVLTLSPAKDPTGAWLGGAAEEKRVRETGASLSSLPSAGSLSIQPLSTLDFLYPKPFRSPARVESRFAAPDGSELVLVGPAFERDVHQLRVFYGAPERLEEQQVTDLVQADDAYSFEFSLGTAGGVAHVTLPGLYPWDDERGMHGLGLSSIGGETSILEPRPRTELSLAGLAFECAPTTGVWTLSNAPAGAALVASCPPALPGRAYEQRRFAGDQSFHCVGLSSGLASAPDDLTLEAEFTAVVAEIGTGQPPGYSCDAATALTFNPGLSLVWVRLERGEQSAFIALRAPGTPLPFAVGDELEVSYGAYAFPQSEALTLRRPSGELLVWFGQASSLSRLDTPVELSVAEGPEQCATVLGCYYTSQYALRATFGDQTVTVPYGERLEQGGFLVINDGIDTPTAEIADCYDGFSAQAGAELWVVPPVAE